MAAPSQPTITLPGGVVWRLLRDRSVHGDGTTTDDTATVVEVMLPPDTAATATATTHARRDQVVVLSGSLRVALAFTAYDLTAGDTMRIDGSVPHRFENVGALNTRFVLCVCLGWDGAL